MFEHAFITGASSGIGHQLSLLLAAEGTHVVVAARRETELNDLVEAIRHDGGKASACVLDVRKPEAVQEAIDKWERETGGLDLVVANAGLGGSRKGHKLRWEDVGPIMEVNVIGAMATLVAALPFMVERSRGTLVGVSSLASMRGLPTSGPYSASKAALATFLESLRIDLRPKGVTVVDVRPGFVDTEMTRKNKFRMPFLMDVKDAAEAMLKGITRGQAVIAFPWPMSTAMTVAETMPDALWRGVAGRFK